MQEQKINTLYYLAIQNTYDVIELAVFSNETILNKKIISKTEASKKLITSLDSTLKESGLKINDLTFIAANQGPGPFTTLRVVITTVNAINFAVQIPLIGIDGLKAIINEYKNSNWPITIALLNAFNNDVYYAIQNNDEFESGWANIDKLLEKLKIKLKNQNIRFIGNASELFVEKISNTFAHYAEFPYPMPQYCSLEQIAKMGLKNWHDKENITQQLYPLYLKDAVKI